jgi:hypothetical protein
MTRYEAIMIELEVIRLITFSEGNSIDEKMYNAIDKLKSELKRTRQKELVNKVNRLYCRNR